MKHLQCFAFPLVLVSLGVVAAYAFAQSPASPEAAPIVPNDIPQWVQTLLGTGGLAWLVRAGGLPLQVTIALGDRDRDLLRDIRDTLHRNEGGQ
jgi:hypothetical protein